MSVLNITTRGASPASPDNADVINSVIASAQPGDTVWVPPGTFMARGNALRCRTGVNLQIDGWLRSVPSAVQPYRLLSLEGLSDIHINSTTGGGLIGEREGHTAPEDCQSHNLAIYNSNRIVVTGITSNNARGDNFYLEGVTNTTVQHCVARNAERSNMSIIDADTLNVLDNLFAGATGPAPMPNAGIDIEPDLATQRLRNILITRNVFSKNKGTGIYWAVGRTQNISNVQVIGNTYDQHYPDGSGPPTKGYNTTFAYFLYNFRFLPGYDYWAWPTSWTV